MTTPNFSIDLSGRTAIVTGASAGLGRRFAKVLAACGAKVACTARRKDKLDDLVKERDLALVLITHDMSVVAQTCDKVVIMYAGRAVEQGPVEAIFDAPQHPYTQALIGCIPKGLGEDEHLTGIPGTVPTVMNYPKGCPFHPRCDRARDICATDRPAFVEHGQRAVACHFAEGAT